MCAHPVLARVAVDKAAGHSSARHAPPLRRDAHRSPQQHSVLHYALCLAPAELQQAVEDQPEAQSCLMRGSTLQNSPEQHSLLVSVLHLAAAQSCNPGAAFSVAMPQRLPILNF